MASVERAAAHGALASGRAWGQGRSRHGRSSGPQLFLERPDSCCCARPCSSCTTDGLPRRAGRLLAGIAAELPAAALHPHGFFVLGRALELAAPADVLLLAPGLTRIGPELARDVRGVHHLTKLTELLARRPQGPAPFNRALPYPTPTLTTCKCCHPSRVVALHV